MAQRLVQNCKLKLVIKRCGVGIDTVAVAAALGDNGGAAGKEGVFLALKAENKLALDNAEHLIIIVMTVGLYRPSGSHAAAVDPKQLKFLQVSHLTSIDIFGYTYTDLNDSTFQTVFSIERRQTAALKIITDNIRIKLF